MKESSCGHHLATTRKWGANGKNDENGNSKGS